MVLLFLGSEKMMRLLGYKPWSYYYLSNEPTMHEYHPVLGWRNKQGQYKLSPYAPDEPDLNINFLKDGMRRTSINQKDGGDQRKKLIFVGCSYTQGWAISDDETFPWKVQERLQSFEVLNYGTGGYGTYQSLLALEQILPYSHQAEIVVYGFIDHHEIRNVSPAEWTEILSKYSGRGHVFVPYSSISTNGLLARHQPEKYPAFPFKEKSALITLVEKVYMQIKTTRIKNQKTQVTQQLLLEMKKLCDKYGIHFIVAMLSSNNKTKEDYMRFMYNNGIMVSDCAYELTGEMRVSEGHPNGKMNSKWANCIVDFIKDKGLLNN